MKRLLMLLVVLLMVGLFLPGCEEEGTSAAAEFGAQEGERPKTKEKRPPPGPAQGGFQEGEAGAAGDTPPPPGDD